MPWTEISIYVILVSQRTLPSYRSLIIFFTPDCKNYKIFLDWHIYHVDPPFLFSAGSKFIISQVYTVTLPTFMIMYPTLAIWGTMWFHCNFSDTKLLKCVIGQLHSQPFQKEFKIVFFFTITTSFHVELATTWQWCGCSSTEHHLLSWHF